LSAENFHYGDTIGLLGRYSEQHNDDRIDNPCDGDAVTLIAICEIAKEQRWPLEHEE
jgi:hypothetical protein